MRTDNDRDREYFNRNTSAFLVLVLAALVKLPQLRAHRMHRPAGDRAVLAALWVYRRHLSKHTPRCKQAPCCSAYCRAAVEDHGWRQGVAMTLKRMGPCL